MNSDKARLLNAYLVASARAGSRQAFERLAANWHPRLLAHAVRLTGERETARDAVQVAWGEIVRGLGGLRDEQAFAAWAYRIVTRSCAGEIKGKVRRRALAAAVKREPMERCTEPVEPSEGDALRRAIRALPAGERAAIALYHFEEMSVAQTAVALNVPVGTAKTRLMNARRKLRKLLEGEMQ
ncbi:RNA polymerase sigma factor [Erythrobacter sp. W53]|uniref:RNA polymerase sigma factor n=1 Tax=Erythrobacter sp. W53 TaxID=3425947 RepID=UPI003D767E2C